MSSPITASLASSIRSPSSVRASTLGSVGGGLRLRLFKHLVGGLTVGVPLTTLSNFERGKARVVFTARGEF